MENKITFTDMAIALAKDYTGIYCINTKDDSYVEYSRESDSKKLERRSEGEDFFADGVKNCKIMVHSEDQEKFNKFLDKEQFMKRISRGKTFNLDYRLIINGKEIYCHLKTVKGVGKDAGLVFVGVSNIDKEKRIEIKQDEERKKFVSIANALAARYELLYYINIKTGEYTTYTASERYEELRSGEHGNDFFSDAKTNCEVTVYHEDLDMVKNYLEKERFLTMIKEDENVSLTYRLVIQGKVQYMNMFAVKTVNNEEHIIIAVSDITAAKKRELEMKEALGNAMSIAIKDQLTGVNSKYAYTRDIAELEFQINENTQVEFGVAICDINGLKQINDTLGHAAGDEYIKEGCMLVCNIFKHSPVFRIGGDEFVVILTNRDYENREELIQKFIEEIYENKKKGKVTISIGLAVFERDKDRIFKDVFERADKEMYKFKEKFKREDI
ncbi:MAG: GGDEF domain-containing protein [Firmicutes bacterium]|nr:GGDEF domain-containing protein [Bacillota bacterium]